DENESVALMNSLIQARIWTVQKLDPGRSTRLDYINIDPAILLLRRGAGARDPAVCSDPLALRPSEASGDPWPAGSYESPLWDGRAASTSWSPLSGGQHVFVWYAWGDLQSYGSPRIRATLHQRMGGMEWPGRSREVELNAADTPYAIGFDAPEGAEASMTFE